MCMKIIGNLGEISYYLKVLDKYEPVEIHWSNFNVRKLNTTLFVLKKIPVQKSNLINLFKEPW